MHAHTQALARIFAAEVTDILESIGLGGLFEEEGSFTLFLPNGESVSASVAAFPNAIINQARNPHRFSSNLQVHSMFHSNLHCVLSQP
jgi:hypothetical protein